MRLADEAMSLATRSRALPVELVEAGSVEDLPPEAVLKKVIHALESPRPRARYRVTFPTSLFATLKRLLPDRAMDRILARY